MSPLDVQNIGEELAIKWDDGTETYIPLVKLRRHCPCAACKGEVDIMGRVYNGQDRLLPPEAFRLARVVNVGGYALQPIWGDGHNTGLFPYDYLRRVAEMP